jgi:ribA/ribD-fused uncharacterized protein
MKKLKVGNEKIVKKSDKVKNVVKVKPLKSVSSKKSEANYIRYNASITQHSWLSNFQNCMIVLYLEKGSDETLTFANAEAAFQYFKTRSPEQRQKIYNCVKASDARYQGSEKAGCVMRKDWFDIREPVMLAVLKAKYMQNYYLRKWLIATDKAELIELSPWDKELFWGTDDSGNGENKSGKLTMQVREWLREMEENRVVKIYVGAFL